MASHPVRRRSPRILLGLLAIIIVRFFPTVHSSYQQHILTFDDVEPSSPADDPDHPSASAEPDPTVPPAPVPRPTGLVAMAIQRATGWNDTVVAKLIGQIAPRAPHPFVVPITDDNYEQVLQSPLDSIRPGWGSDGDTVWVISVVATDRASGLFEDVFDELASNASQAVNPPPRKMREDEVTITQLEPDDPHLFGPHIRFGRIDYMAKTDVILTKWLIFKCPLLVVVTNSGKDVRFFKTGAVPPKADHLGEFLREQRWTYKPVWNSTFSPGNSGEWIVAGLGKAFGGFHTLTDKVPGWVLMMLSSMLGTSLMQWLHAAQSKKHPKPQPPPPRTLKEELAQAAVGLAEASAARRQKEDGSTSNVSHPQTGSSSGVAQSTGSTQKRKQAAK